MLLLSRPSAHIPKPTVQAHESAFGGKGTKPFRIAYIPMVGRRGREEKGGGEKEGEEKRREGEGGGEEGRGVEEKGRNGDEWREMRRYRWDETV